MRTHSADTEYAPFYAGYVSLVPEADICAVLDAQPEALRRYAASVPAAGECHRYAPDKWSVREVVGHMADTERVFGYRAFCVSRGEQKALPGFDENAYVAASAYDTRRLEDLVADFAAVRAANLTVLRELDQPRWERVGTANGAPISVRAMARVMAGHVRHHLAILESRYRR